MSTHDPDMGGVIVFGRRRSRKSEAQQFVNELGESYGHLKLAAAHAAAGAAEKLTPPYDKARNAATRRWSTTRDVFLPVYQQVRLGAANARKEYETPKKKRWPWLVGLLAAGAAVGAAGAMIARRRRAAQEWDEYQPLPPFDDAGFGMQTAESTAEPTGIGATGSGVSSGTETGKEKTSAGKKVSTGAASVADSVSGRAGKIADSLRDSQQR